MPPPTPSPSPPGCLRASQVSEYAHVAWVQSLPYDPANFTFTQLREGGLRGVLSVGKPALRTPSVRPAASLFAIVGEAPEIVLGASPGAVPVARFDALTVGAQSTRTLRVLMAIGRKAADAQALAQSAASSTHPCCPTSRESVPTRATVRAHTHEHAHAQNTTFGVGVRVRGEGATYSREPWGHRVAGTALRGA